MIHLLPIFAIPANRLRGQEGWAGVGRLYMALLAAFPVYVHDALFGVFIAALSFWGVTVSHGKYFTLETPEMWARMSLTGLAYVAPGAIAFMLQGDALGAFAFFVAGMAKPLAYYAARKLQPGKDFLALAEYSFGGIICAGLLVAYRGLA